jgi:hypothetical protein
VFTSLSAQLAAEAAEVTITDQDQLQKIKNIQDELNSERRQIMKGGDGWIEVQQKVGIHHPRWVSYIIKSYN